MNPKSSKALVGAAVLSLVFGGLIGSPDGRLFCFGLAAAFAAVPALFSKARMRIVSAVLLTLSLALAANVYPEYAKRLDRVRAKASAGGASTPLQQQERR